MTNVLTLYMMILAYFIGHKCTELLCWMHSVIFCVRQKATINFLWFHWRFFITPSMVVFTSWWVSMTCEATFISGFGAISIHFKFNTCTRQYQGKRFDVKLFSNVFVSEFFWTELKVSKKTCVDTVWKLQNDIFSEEKQSEPEQDINTYMLISGTSTAQRNIQLHECSPFHLKMRSALIWQNDKTLVSL